MWTCFSRSGFGSFFKDERVRPEVSELTATPQFPTIATKVSSVLSNEDAQLQVIARLIRADPALAAELSSLVNSALYGSLQPIDSI